MTFDEVSQTVRRIMRDIGPPIESSTDPDVVQHDTWELSDDQILLPEVLLWILTQILGLKRYGPYEKMRWGVLFTYHGIPFGFELRKFGLVLMLPANEESRVEVGPRLLRNVARVMRVVERYLSQIAKRQAYEGNITIANQFEKLDGAYQFYRKHAEAVYEPPTDATNSTSALEQRTRTKGPDIFRVRAEGFYFASAMLDAYFSRLEHTLLLVLPFVGFDPREGRLIEFAYTTWDEKYKAVFDCSCDLRAKGCYEELRSLKEKLRNPLAHGGIEKNLGSFYFHVPHIGAVPSSLGRWRESIDHGFFPIPRDRFDEVRRVFDRADGLLNESRTGMGMKFVRSGLDVAFDAESRAKYADAMREEEIFERFVDKLAWEHDQHINMDY
jgi:hypothetical protein